MKKLCYRCGERERVYEKGKKTFSSYCAQCKSDIVREAFLRRGKTCKECFEILPYSDFPKRKNNTTYSVCKKCKSKEIISDKSIPFEIRAKEYRKNLVIQDGFLLKFITLFHNLC